MRGKLLKFSLLTPLAVWFCAGEVIAAADDFKKGCEFYNNHNYTQARPLLEDTVKNYPAYWPGHYYLAHTYLALGQKNAAKTEYETCQSCHPSLEVYAACQKVVLSLGGASATPTGGSLPPVDPLAAAAAGGGDDKDEKKSLSPREQQVEENKKWVMKAARDQCDHMRTDMETDVYNCNSMGRWRQRISTGEVFRANPSGEKSIREDYAARMKKVMEDAQKKVLDMK